MEIFNNPYMAYVPFIIWSVIACIIIFVNKSSNNNRRVVAWLIATAALPLMLGGIFFLTTEGALPLVFIAIILLIFCALTIEIGNRSR